MRTFKATLALLGWFALSLQCYLTVRLSLANGKTLATGLANFLSFFTILSNLLVAIVLTFSRWKPDSRGGAFLSSATVQSGAAVHIAIVGIVYSLVLRELWSPQGWQKLADVLLHDAIPVLYVIFWFLFVPKSGLRWKHALWWLGFPAIYCAYSLVRGALTGWYPYPFIDASQLGYVAVTRNALVLLAAFLAVGLVFVGVGKWLARPGLVITDHSPN
jgi:hypothetical protein